MLNFKTLSLSVPAALAAALLLSSCSADGPAPQGSGAGSSSPATASRQEVSALAPRAVLTYDGGLLTVDTETGEVLATTETEGFLRLNPAGDGRHVLVSAGDEFRVFDSGLIVQGHGGHNHYYEQAPVLTGGSIKAPEAGHAVVHAGRTALFADGSGRASVLDTGAFEDGQVDSEEIQEHAAEAPHHGVAVPLADGNLLMTSGTEGSRNTVQVRSPEGAVLAETTDCPGVHGEAVAMPTAQGDVVSLGCENGPVIYRDGAFHQVPVPEAYQRSGNQFGSHESPVVLVDYKTDPDAEQERPTRIGLIDTVAGSMKTVELGSAYWFRSLARGAEGEAVILTYDGNLMILDEETGETLRAVPVVGPWEEPKEWQLPAPAVKVGADGLAYVTEPAAKKLHVVDIAAGTVLSSFDLPEAPTELAIVTGEAEDAGRDNGHGHDGHGHGED